MGYLINSGPFGYVLKVNDIPDVEISDQHYLILDLDVRR
jgi:hypothetical protein